MSKEWNTVQCSKEGSWKPTPGFDPQHCVNWVDSPHLISTLGMWRQEDPKFKASLMLPETCLQKERRKGRREGKELWSCEGLSPLSAFF